MGFTTLAENKLLRLLFNNVDWDTLGDSSGIQGSATAGDWAISLHTADPGEGAGYDQTTNEASFTNYARVTKSRSGTGQWTVTASTDDIQIVSNATAVTFPTASSSGEIITHASIGTNPGTGSGRLYLVASLTSPYTVTNDAAPEFAIGDLQFRAE